ncbi:MAG: phospho-N-acetylmuramoyl-pentapeptide-transferase [Bacillota bacterium]
MVALMCFFSSLCIVLLLSPAVIPHLRRLKLGQRVRDDGPASHKSKEGTPTMGGVIIMAAVLPTALLFGRLAATERWRPGRIELLLPLVLVCTGYAIIGFADDFLKVVKRRSLGLRARHKLLWQVVLAALLTAAVQRLDLGTHVIVPYVLSSFDLGNLGYSLLGCLVVVGCANAVNLTDGLDGLAAGTCAIAFGVYWLISVAAGRNELAVVSAAFAGACLGFLRYNFHPAKVFMGDTGSLALGSALGGLALLTKTELVLPVIGGVFVIETVSVILQVLSFRLTGRRVFRMSPLHHHFELCGVPERRVVVGFYALGVLFAVAGLLGLTGV